MPTYAIQSDEGTLLDARLEIFPSTIVIHSRGGTKGKNAINPDYSVALRLILSRLSANNILITGAWVDSSRVQHLPLSERAILHEDDQSASPEERFKLLTNRMQKVGRVSPTGGNSTKKIRIELAGDMPAASIADGLNAVAAPMDLRSLDRLPADDLNKVSPEHIWNAIRKRLGGYTKHGFGESTDFDLITDDGRRLSPKAVFGIAAAEALGFKVLPKHFAGGERSPCFRILTSSGYIIAPKSSDPATDSDNQVTRLASDEQWTEGRRKLVTHVRKERGAPAWPKPRRRSSGGNTGN